MKLRSIWSWSTLIFLVGLACIMFTLFVNREAQSEVITDNRNGSEVRFEIDQNRVLSPNDCVTLIWDVENIAGVYLEDDGVIGQDSREWCVLERGNKPTLRVIFPEDFVQEYTLTIRIVPLEIGFVLGIVLVLIGCITSNLMPILLFRRHVRQQQRPMTLLIYLWIISILFVYWSVSGQPGANLIINSADNIARFIRETLSAPYLG